jgi:HEPN domain-containing protein
MKSNWDTAQGWLRKADSDLAAAEVCLTTRKALDAACFHCQQAAEKSLKAWLIATGVRFPFVHDLRRLLNLCASAEPSFQQLEPFALSLNPFAVDTRYDNEFWPTPDEVEQALGAARAIRRLVTAHFPSRPD